MYNVIIIILRLKKYFEPINNDLFLILIRSFYYIWIYLSYFVIICVLKWLKKMLK